MIVCDDSGLHILAGASAFAAAAPMSPYYRACTSLCSRPLCAPHVTVFIGRSTTRAESAAVAHRVASRLKALDLIFWKLDYAPLFTKTFFVQFRESECAQLMSHMIGQNLTRPSAYKLNPHLSLLYQNIGETSQRALCRRTNIPMGTYRFDTLHVIESKKPVTNAAAVRQWRRITSVKLC